MYQMKKEYLTGIDFIDAEHTKLFEITNRVYEVMKDELIPDKYDYIVAILKELKEYTQYHFKHEEDYMKSIKYKRLLSQLVQHQDFIEQLEEIDLETLDTRQEETMMNLLEFLNEWLVHHICESDKLITKG